MWADAVRGCLLNHGGAHGHRGDKISLVNPRLTDRVPHRCIDTRYQQVAVQIGAVTFVIYTLKGHQSTCKVSGGQMSIGQLNVLQPLLCSPFAGKRCAADSAFVKTLLMQHLFLFQHYRTVYLSRPVLLLQFLGLGLSVDSRVHPLPHSEQDPKTYPSAAQLVSDTPENEAQRIVSTIEHEDTSTSFQETFLIMAW